ncbi:hypothetical protein H0Z60_02360 [Ectothiorhodospiraceae bacterium WFHF3C12]|nr:hypothetical protein [Ectothiorhodospiraceae bacterium WFHF3C12]
MTYSEEKLAYFEEEFRRVTQGLQDLMQRTVVAEQEFEDAKLKEHLLHGAARRLSILKKCVENIFDHFPPTVDAPLQMDVLYDVQINLHAYFINLYGIFDNWAWSFVLRHDLLKAVGGKHGVGLFRESTRKHLAKPLQEYLVSNAIASWHEDYLKSYRDALAHRIPLYIPPAEVTKEEGERYKQLERDKIGLIRAMDWDALEAVHEEQRDIGRPSFVFLHSYEEEPPKPVLFHPQVLSDGLAIVEFGNLFLENWGELAEHGV